MKGLTEKLKQESVEKWEEIIKNLEARKRYVEPKDSYYFDEYWNPCGFCKAVENLGLKNCRACGLHKKHEGMLICDSAQLAVSYVKDCIVLADDGYFDKALDYARIVLDYIKKEKAEGINDNSAE